MEEKELTHTKNCKDCFYSVKNLCYIDMMSIGHIHVNTINTTKIISNKNNRRYDYV